MQKRDYHNLDNKVYYAYHLPMRLELPLQYQPKEHYPILATVGGTTNPFKDAQKAPHTEAFLHRLVTVKAGEFMVSDGDEIPSTESMASCIAVGLYSQEDRKAAIAHFTVSNDPQSLIVDVLTAMYPKLSSEHAARKVLAVMRGGMDEIESSRQLAAGLIQTIVKHDIRLVGAELFCGLASGEAFGIDPRDCQIYTGATGINGVQKGPTPKDYYTCRLKPLIAVERPPQ